MKAMRYLTIAAAVAAGAFCQGQAVFISVEFQTAFSETSDGTPVANAYSAGSSGPNIFIVNVESDDADLSGIDAPQYSYNGGGGVSLGINGDNWRTREFFPNSGALLTAHPAGNYGISAGAVSGSGGTNYTLSLSGALMPNAPDISLSVITGSYSWAGGGMPKIYVTPGTQLSISSGTFSNWTTNASEFNHIGLFVSGNIDLGEESFGARNSAIPSILGSYSFTSDSLTITPTFTSGTYFVEAEFNAISDFDDAQLVAGENAIALAMYTSRTTLSIEVIPEPSTYAAIFGVAALAGVMLHRRRRALA
jgi:hypothetical protein